jgi:hypothetical protein
VERQIVLTTHVSKARDSRRSSEDRRGVECSDDGEGVDAIVGRVGHEVEHGADRLALGGLRRLWLGYDRRDLFAAAALPQLASALDELDRRRRAGRSSVAVAVSMAISRLVRAVGRDEARKPLKQEEGGKAGKDGQADDDVPLGFDDDDLNATVDRRLAEERVGQEMQGDVAKERADRKDREQPQRLRVDVGRHRCEQQIGDRADVEGGHQGIVTRAGQAGYYRSARVEAHKHAS